jgi:hypothetical protein
LNFCFLANVFKTLKSKISLFLLDLFVATYSGFTILGIKETSCTQPQFTSSETA